MKPLTTKEIEIFIKKLKEESYDPESSHLEYERILERYCLYPDPKIRALMEKLILELRPNASFWYA